MGLHLKNIHKLQLCKIWWHMHVCVYSETVTLLLHDLHCLPVCFQVHFKMWTSKILHDIGLRIFEGPLSPITSTFITDLLHNLITFEMLLIAISTLFGMKLNLKIKSIIDCQKEHEGMSSASLLM